MPSESHEPARYYAFISYSHADKQWADWLHRAIETYRVPKLLVGRPLPGGGAIPARLFPIFRDREELPVSADLGGNIKEALRTSRNLVVICSPRAATSLWVDEEIRVFKTLGRGNRLQCLIVGGEPNASDKPEFASAAECFPPAVRFRVDAGGELTTERTEPIAADTRPGMDGKTNALLKVLAAILGVKFDDLKQRERIRRRKRIAGGILAFTLLVAIGLGIWQFQAWQGRRRLDEQRRDQESALQEEQGRQALLAGHATAAADALQKVMDTTPEDRPAARLMLGVARRQASGLIAVLDSQANISNILMSPDGKHLVVAGLMVAGVTQPAASLWDLQTNRLARNILGVLQFNRSSDKLLLAREEGCVVHDVATGAEVTLPGDVGSQGCFLGDGSQVLCYQNPASGAPQVPQFTIFDASSGHPLRRFDIGPGSAGGIAADPAGETALAYWYAPAPPAPPPPGFQFPIGEPRLKWFDIKSAKIIADLPRHDSGFAGLSPDGERLLYQRPDGTFEARSKTAVLWTFPSTQSVPPLEYWSRGGRFAILNALGKSVIVDAATGARLWDDNFWNFTTDPSDSCIAYSDAAGVVHVRELTTGRPLAEYTDRIGWADPSQYPMDRLALFSPDATRLLLAGSGPSVKIWDWRHAGGDRTLLGNPADAARPMDAFFSPDSSTLAVRYYDGTATLWDVATGSRQKQIASSQSDGGVCTIAFSPGGDRLLTGSQEPGDSHAATLWDIPSGKPIVRIDDFPDGISAGGIKTKSPMFDQHIRVAWGPDRFVTINFNLGLGSLWDAASQAKVCDFPVGANMMELSAAGRFSSQLSLAQGGARFIVAGFDDTARVFALHDAKLIAALKHPFPGLSSAELSADGSTALTFGPGTPPVVWSVPGGSITLSLDTDTSNVNEAHLSADGRYVAGACSDQCVRLWDARTGQVSTTFREENQPGEGVDSLGAPIDLAAMQGKRVALGFLSLQFDPHGRWVAAINDIGHLCLWDIPSRRQLLRWKLDAQSRDAHLAVSPDGNRLALTGENGAVTLFNLTPDAPQQALK